MFKFGRKRNKIKYKSRERDIDPDEIFIDSKNLPNFDTYQFEGRLEKTISRGSIFTLAGIILFVIIIFVLRIGDLQIVNGSFYFSKSENNRLRSSLVFAKRGVIYDRVGAKLAWNVENNDSNSFDLRKYISVDGFSHLLGYVKYPQKDKAGFYYSKIFEGKGRGVEQFYNDYLAGKNGSQITEVDALGDIQSENIMVPPVDGDDVTLTVDYLVQDRLYQEIKDLAIRAGYSGGAGIIMDVYSGEVLSLTSYPEYDSQILTDGEDDNLINRYLNDKNNPFLNRVIDGLYTPGSTVKPFMAYSALNEKIIDPNTNILSTGSISIPNPYDASRPTVFKDWKAHGYVDMRKALAVSSDVYFYAIGGGYEKQKGLGIVTIDKYMRLFGFGESLLSPFFSGVSGVIPTPEWKKEKFNGEEWRVGNTYHTSIGQYGFQISPVQMVRAVAALANGGKLIEPKIVLNDKKVVAGGDHDLSLNQEYLKIIKEGMRDSVTKDYGVARNLNSLKYTVAAKTGTAELGVYKQFINSWVTGFFPYENPRYAFVVIMEKGSADNTTGALFVMRQVLDYMAVYKPEYLN